MPDPKPTPHTVQTSSFLLSVELDEFGDPIVDDVVQLDTTPTPEDEPHAQ